MKRFGALVLAYFFLALAIIGVFLPGLPTVPFLLLSAWFAARGSDKLHRWLYAHPHFGQLLIDWEQQGAIARKSKITAIVMLIASWLLMYKLSGNPWLLAALALIFVSVATFLMTRPEPQ